MEYKRRQNDVKGVACQRTTQIADIAVDHTRASSQAFSGQRDHVPAAVHSNNARTSAGQPIRVPAMAAAGVENVLAGNSGQKSEHRGALVERVPRSLVGLS